MRMRNEVIPAVCSRGKPRRRTAGGDGRMAETLRHVGEVFRSNGVTFLSSKKWNHEIRSFSFDSRKLLGSVQRSIR